MLKCIIIDDEQFSIEALVKYIELVPKLEIVAIYTNPKEALEGITMGVPVDVLFMDIDMPFLSGIELAKVIRSKTKKLIFTTSHSKYAFDAFEAEGDAYLLKPYSFAKFSSTLNRLFPDETTAKTPEVNNEDDYFMVKNKEEDLRIIKVRYKDVVAFESLHNYIKIYLVSNKTLVAYLTIKDIIEILKARSEFRQFHRAFIISTDFINYIEGNMIKMHNDLCFTIGESYKSDFSAYMSNKLLKTSRRN